MERLFDLDLQLIADSAFTAVNVLILFIIASYLFFDPVRNFLQSRQSRIKNDLATADMEKNQAMQMKAEYEAKLKDINKEAEEILSDARKKAMKNEARIVDEAKAEAARIMEQARKEAAEKVAKDNSALSEIDDLTLMAAIIYCEAGAEPYETQLAVGAVIVNRMHSQRFGGTLFEVLSRPGQFTPYRTGKLAKAVAESKAKPSCYDAARAALAGEDNTNGCLFFNDYNGTKEGIRYGGMVFWW